MSKRLGQHFLSDTKILQKIVVACDINRGDTVLEIGPGRGSLTKLLLEQAGKVIAVEKDANLAGELEKKFKLEIENSKLKIIQGDILDFENLLEIAKLKIENYILVGNIPYYITGEILRKFLETGNQPRSITFVLQKEVAQRIVAKDGKESILSISVKAYGIPEYGGIIKAGSFSPPPKVDSAILSIKQISKKCFERDFRRADEPEKRDFPAGKYAWSSEKHFFELLKKGFSHKRKLLIKNLGVSAEIFAKLGLNPKSRAEDIHVEQWFELSKAL